MIVRSLDVDNDWEFGKGFNDYKFGKPAVAQNIQTRLLMFLGDCFFAVTQGPDWFNLLGAKNQVAINLAVNDTLVNTPGVTGIEQISIDLDSKRNLSMIYSATVSQAIADERSITGTVSLLLTEDGDFLTTEDGDSLAVET